MEKKFEILETKLGKLELLMNDISKDKENANSRACMLEFEIHDIKAKLQVIDDDIETLDTNINDDGCRITTLEKTLQTSLNTLTTGQIQNRQICISTPSPLTPPSTTKKKLILAFLMYNYVILAIRKS